MRTLALVACLTVGCFRGATPPPPPTAPVAPKAARSVASSDPLAYLPAESTLVVVVELKELMASQSMKSMLPLIEKRLPATVAQQFATCGFDPLSLKRASMGLHDIGASKPRGTLVIRGYHRDVLMKCIEQAQAAQPSELTVDNGVILVPVTDSKVAMTFADDTTLVIQVGPETTAATLRAAIDAGAPLRLDTRFLELMGKLEPSHPLWFIFDDAKLMASAPLGSPMRSVLGSARINDSLIADVRLRFADPTGASSVAAMMQGQISSATMFFDELTITPDDSDVVVHAAMSDAKLSSAIGMLGGVIGP